MSQQPHVVVLGAGFAGLGAVRKLKGAPVRITLIDRNDYHTFQPLLYQLATAELDASEVGFPVREIMHHQSNVLFHMASVKGIDLAKKQVTIDAGEPISYDYLVVALGSGVNFFNTPGAAEHAFPLYTMNDAHRLKNHLLSTLEQADKDPSLIDDGALTIAIVGGGPTGVETAGAMAEFLHAAAEKDYPNLPIRDKGEVVLFEHGGELLKPFLPNLQDYAKDTLEKLGVTVRLGEGVSAIAADSITLASGEVVKTRTLVWGAGVQANSLGAALGVETVHGGRVPVGPDLSLAGHPEVFVIGDVALITDAGSGDQLPQLGSVAQQAGHHAARNIAALVDGGKTAPFDYLDKGTMATIGRGAAVVQLPGSFTITGYAAWMTWLGVHAILLSGGEERTATMIDWGWNLITRNRGKRIIIPTEGS